MPRRSPTRDARELRRQQTKAESLLWSVLRGRQICHLKFRRQHPEPPFILDFACISAMLGVELDGSYHEQQLKKDTDREAFLSQKGWNIIRFTNEDVLVDPESVAIAIAHHLGLQYEFKERSGELSSVMDRHRLDHEEKRRARE